MWLRLARARAAFYPVDAIRVLLCAANRTIEERSRAYHRTAADLLTEARSLSTRCGTGEAFLGHLVALRSTNRAKPALREELDRVGLD